MIAENSDTVALTAQADIYRLYLKVIQPGLAEFTEFRSIPIEATDIDSRLEAARIYTHNTLCYEIRRSFALTLAALFERQLRSWLLGKLPADEKVKKAKWQALVAFVNRVDISITANPIMDDLDILRLVANAMRHGPGESVEILRRRAPELWNEAHTGPEINDPTGSMRISDDKLERFAEAIMKFWHLAGASSVPGSPTKAGSTHRPGLSPPAAP
jgi:hypothetical protein